MRWRSRPKQGAGTLVYVGRFDLAEFAVVLEPDEPLRAGAARVLRRHGGARRCARRARAAGNADHHRLAGRDLRSIAALVGGGRLAWPKGAREDEPPPWLVFGAMIRTVSMSEPSRACIRWPPRSRRKASPTSCPTTWSKASRAISWSRSMPGRSTASARSRSSYLARLPPEQGVRRDIDDNGDLLMRRIGKTDVERKTLLPALAAPSWLDPATKGPRA